MPVAPWTSPYTVRAYEAGPSGQATMQALCDYFQETAGHHADALGVSISYLAPMGLAWVQVRLHVQVDRYPAWGETVHVRTWPSGRRGLLAYREYLLLADDGAGMAAEEAVLARGSSAWVLFDVERRRPTRLTPDVHALEPPDLPLPLADPFPDLPASDAADLTLPFRVRHSDLDLNRHVNNVRYVEWAAEAVPEAVLERQRLGRVEVQYKAETTYGHTIQVETTAMDAGTYLHRLRRQGDGAEVARARTRWTPAED